MLWTKSAALGAIHLPQCPHRDIESSVIRAVSVGTRIVSRIAGLEWLIVLWLSTGKSAGDWIRRNRAVNSRSHRILSSRVARSLSAADESTALWGKCVAGLLPRAWSHRVAVHIKTGVRRV